MQWLRVGDGIINLEDVASVRRVSKTRVNIYSRGSVDKYQLEFADVHAADEFLGHFERLTDDETDATEVEKIQWLHEKEAPEEPSPLFYELSGG